MPKGMYSKYKKFLIKHELFDNNTFNFIKDNSVMFDFESIEDYKSFGCSIVLNEKGRLVQIIPCVPILKDEETVAINMFVYTEALLLIPLIGKKFDNKYIDKKLPFIFLKLYIMENKELLEIQNKMQFGGGEQYSDELIDTYCQDNLNLSNSARMIKRRARNYLYSRKDV